jgi:hypothetical protein
MADIWTDRLSDYIDGELNDADIAELESHLTSCEECRSTAQQLRAVVSRAGGLQDSAPETDLWAGIVMRLKEDARGDSAVVDIKRAASRHRRVSFTVPQLLAAGIALMFVTAGSVWMAISRSGELGSQAAIELPAYDETSMLLASFNDPGYDAAVAELERILEAGRERLDPATVSVLEQSLATIDQAMAEARAALQTDPTNHYLSEHLSATMNQKIRLLRQAATLVSSAS